MTDALVRELDLLLNGINGAAEKPSLCDIVSQLREVVRKRGAPLLLPPNKKDESLWQDS